jgi:hypothetical protein
MTNLKEGLRANDLCGMVKNIISVDEYQSKIDERAIVIAFYACDRSAAEDLNRFIQKSYVDLLDTEVSAAPDQKGNYMVFVEMAMNDQSAKAVAQLCGDINAISSISQWVVHVRGAEPSNPVPAAKVADFIRGSLALTLGEFFDQSDNAKLTLSEQCWHVGTPTAGFFFQVDDFGSFEQVVKRNALTEAAIDLTPEALRTTKVIRSMLGASWAVERVGDRFAVYHDASDALVLLTTKQ